MKRLIALLIAILALISGAGRTDVTVTRDCMPVSSEITDEQVSTAETPAEAAMSHVLPLEDVNAIDADPCETKPETTDNTPLSETVAETVTESAEMPTEEKEMPDILSSAGDSPIEPVIEIDFCDGGDRVTAETDIEKKSETAVTETQDIPETVVERAPAVVPEYIPAPVIVPNESADDTASPTDGTDAEQQGDANAPIFIDPCQGGPNPFDDDKPTEIDDHNSDEFIGDGDRPGEGIHF